MQSKRLANFEMLRIVAMFMIVTLHLLGNDHGNVLSKTNDYSLAWTVTWSMEGLCTVAVNCFVLISGYFSAGDYNKSDFNDDGRAVKFRIQKILNLCLTVWFYHWIGFIIAVSLKWCDFGRSSLLRAATPILNRSYWFITVYMCLYILGPYINSMLKNLNRNAFKRLICVCILLFCIIPTAVPVYDPFYIGGGNGIIWFVVLYVIGAYLRYYGVPARVCEWKSKQWLIVYLLSCLILILSKVIISFVTQIMIGYSIGTSLLYSYCSPVCLLASVSLFMCFLNLKIDSESVCGRIAVKLSPLMFGVYIIHENPFIKPVMWAVVSPDVGTNTFLLFLKMIIIVFTIIICCSALEWIRQYIFGVIGRTIKNLKSCIKTLG